MRHIVYILWRYVAATLAAFLVSVLVFFFAATAAGRLAMASGSVPGIVAFALALILVGFTGVYAGTITLPRASRWFGSVVLSILGLIFAAFVLTDLSRHPLHSRDGLAQRQNLAQSWVPAMAIGAGIAILVIRRGCSGKGEDPKA